MMNRFFATLFICLFGINASAQRVVQDLYLSNQEGNGPSWFVAYANGDYETTFNTLAEQKIKPPKNQFFTNAYLYANRTSNILDSIPKLGVMISTKTFLKVRFSLMVRSQ